MLHGVCNVIDENIYTYKIWLFGMFFGNIYELFNKLNVYGGIRNKTNYSLLYSIKTYHLKLYKKNKQWYYYA